MRELLKKIGLIGSSPQVTEAYLEVIDMLVALRTARTEVGVKFDGDDADYSSIVTALNARHGIMVIDSPTPSVPLWLLSRGRPVTVTTATQGREIKLKSQFLEPFMPDLNYGLQLQIPQLLGTKQPRSAFRVMLDEMRNKVNVSIWDANNNQISGVARNISARVLASRPPWISRTSCRAQTS